MAAAKRLMSQKITTEDGESRLYDVGVGSLVVGRTEECDLTLADPMVSGRHAPLTVLPEGVGLRDLGSSHGTFVDGKQIQGVTPLVGGEELSRCGS